jgi:hypothetical protein
VLFVIYYLVEEVIEIGTIGKVYFQDFWNLLDILLWVVSDVCDTLCTHLRTVVRGVHRLLRLSIRDHQSTVGRVVGRT